MILPRLQVLTVNTHKGFNPFNRRFILPELREAVRSSRCRPGVPPGGPRLP